MNLYFNTSYGRTIVNDSNPINVIVDGEVVYECEKDGSDFMFSDFEDFDDIQMEEFIDENCHI